jgi:hypothetical protein
MKRTMKLGMIAGVLLAAMTGQAKAYDLTFTFSFTNDSTTPSIGWSSGTIVDQIALATDKTVDEAAQHIFITPPPSNLPGGAFAAYTTTRIE